MIPCLDNVTLDLDNTVSFIHRDQFSVIITVSIVSFIALVISCVVIIYDYIQIQRSEEMKKQLNTQINRRDNINFDSAFITISLDEIMPESREETPVYHTSPPVEIARPFSYSELRL